MKEAIAKKQIVSLPVLPKTVLPLSLVLALCCTGAPSLASRAWAGQEVCPRTAEELVYTQNILEPVPIPPAEQLLQTMTARERFAVPGEGRVLEGALLDPQGNLIFSDVSAHRVLRLSPDKKLSTVVTLDNGLSPAGLALHKDGRLFIAALNLAENRGAILAWDDSGQNLQEIIPVQTGYVPDDLVFDAEGGFYFADFRGIATRAEGGVYYVAPGSGRITAVLPHLAKANGLALSPDGKTLWVTEYARNLLHRVELADATTILPLARPLPTTSPGLPRTPCGQTAMAISTWPCTDRDACWSSAAQACPSARS